MSYKIGSFNVKNLSYNNGVKRDLDRIADIIKQFDIIALQEVLSRGKILEGIQLKDVAGQAKAYEYSLKSRLGPNWDMKWIDPETAWSSYNDNDSRGEGYAFLWRTDKFKLPVNEKGKEFVPRSIHQYKTDGKSGNLRLMRDPGYGRFQLVNMPNIEIRLITTHILFGKANTKASKSVDYGAISMRRNEFNILARCIYTSVCDDHNYRENIVPYTIILGDYNLNLKESRAGNPSMSSVLVIDDHKNELITPEEQEQKGFYFIQTEQTDLSTINKNADQYANNYDHFSYDIKVKNNIIKEAPHTLNVINTNEDGAFEKYKKEVSDHIPIMIEVDF